MSILYNFNFLSVTKQWFIRLRLLSCPFGELISYIPQKGKLLDVGCGFGLLPIMLAQRDSGRKIVGIDPDEKRIEIAKKAGEKYKRLEFRTGVISDIPSSEKFDVITCIDVLYLLPKSEKIKTVKQANKLLHICGLFMIKINDKSRSLSYFFTWLQEIVTVLLLKKTATEHQGLYFESVNELAGILAQCGFKISKTVKLKTPFPFWHPHWLIIAVK